MGVGGEQGCRCCARRGTRVLSKQGAGPFFCVMGTHRHPLTECSPAPREAGTTAWFHIRNRSSQGGLPLPEATRTR